MESTPSPSFSEVAPAPAPNSMENTGNGDELPVDVPPLVAFIADLDKLEKAEELLRACDAANAAAFILIKFSLDKLGFEEENVVVLIMGSSGLLVLFGRLRLS